MEFIRPLLQNFRPYRKYAGGKWYKVRQHDIGGWSTFIEYWTQETPKPTDDVWIVCVEEYGVNRSNDL